MNPYSWDRLKELDGEMMQTVGGVEFIPIFPERRKRYERDGLCRYFYIMRRGESGEMEKYKYGEVLEPRAEVFASYVPTCRDEMRIAAVNAKIRMVTAAYLMAMMLKCEMTMMFKRPKSLHRTDSLSEYYYKREKGRERGPRNKSKRSKGRASGEVKIHDRIFTKPRSDQKPLFKRGGRKIERKENHVPRANSARRYGGGRKANRPDEGPQEDDV